MTLTGMDKPILDVLHEADRPMTGADIARRVGVEPWTIGSRLTSLRKRGLISRTENGAWKPAFDEDRGGLASDPEIAGGFYGNVTEVFRCPDCGRTGTHAAMCEAFPGQPVTHGNREHWVARSPRDLRVRVAPNEDVAEHYRRSGWAVEGPFVLADHVQR